MLSCDDLKSGQKAVNAETLIPVFTIFSVWLRISFVPTGEVGVATGVLIGSTGTAGFGVVEVAFFGGSTWGLGVVASVTAGSVVATFIGGAVSSGVLGVATIAGGLDDVVLFGTGSMGTSVLSPSTATVTGGLDAVVLIGTGSTGTSILSPSKDIRTVSMRVDDVDTVFEGLDESATLGVLSSEEDIEG